MFPGLGAMLDSLQNTGDVVVTSGPAIVPPVVLHAEYLSGHTRLTVTDADPATHGDIGDSAVLAALQAVVPARAGGLQRAPDLFSERAAQRAGR